MISVIIPTYNRARLLTRAMDSILHQTYQELELIVVDDASNDDTAARVRDYADPRVRYVKLDRNQGACVARNIGVQHSRGEWVAFQDSDDEWMTQKLEMQLSQLQGSGADVVFCAFDRYNSEGEKIQTFPHAYVQPGKITYEQLLFENLVSTQTILGKKVCFEQVPFRADYPRLQDWELMLRMVQQYDVRYFNDVLVRVHEQPDSISKQPEKAVIALEMLYKDHWKAIRRDDRLTMQMCYSLSCAQVACGKPTWKTYLRALSFHHSPEVNAQLLRTGIRRMLIPE